MNIRDCTKCKVGGQVMTVKMQRALDHNKAEHWDGRLGIGQILAISDKGGECGVMSGHLHESPLGYVACALPYGHSGLHLWCPALSGNMPWYKKMIRGDCFYYRWGKR